MNTSVIRSIKDSRICRKLTQMQVAAYMGTSQSAVSDLETGRNSNLTIETLEAYAKACGCRLKISVTSGQICQTVHANTDLITCPEEESGGNRCEEIGAHTRHRIGRHTIAHSLRGNGFSCDAFDDDALAMVAKSTRIDWR